MNSCVHARLTPHRKNFVMGAEWSASPVRTNLAFDCTRQAWNFILQIHHRPGCCHWKTHTNSQNMLIFIKCTRMKIGIRSVRLTRLEATWRLVHHAWSIFRQEHPTAIDPLPPPADHSAPITKFLRWGVRWRVPTMANQQTRISESHYKYGYQRHQNDDKQDERLVTNP